MSKNITQLHNISPDEFKEDILSGVRKELLNFSKKFQPKTESTWLTRKDVKEVLSISYPTIHKWCHKGILKPYKIGRQIRFKREEILKELEDSSK